MRLKCSSDSDDMSFKNTSLKVGPLCRPDSDSVNSSHGRGRPAEWPHCHHLQRTAALLRIPTLPQELFWSWFLSDACTPHEGSEEEGGEADIFPHQPELTLRMYCISAVYSVPIFYTYTYKRYTSLSLCRSFSFGGSWKVLYLLVCSPQNDCDCASDCDCTCSICTKYKDQSQNQSQHLDRVLDGKKKIFYWNCELVTCFVFMFSSKRKVEIDSRMKVNIVMVLGIWPQD